MPRLAPALVAEAIGVFALSFVGILAIQQFHEAQYNVGLIGIALAHGLILAIMISAMGHISGGHFNPAVTVGLLSIKKIAPGPALLYIIAQVIGGILAGLAVLAIMKFDGAAVIARGTPMIGSIPNASPAVPVVTVGGALLAEFIATFFLVTAVLGTAVDARAPKIGGFGIGLTVAADILAIGPLTGAAMNPARTFGPQLVASLSGAPMPWTEHWLYWVGPIAGGVAAAQIYKLFFASDVK